MGRPIIVDRFYNHNFENSWILRHLNFITLIMPLDLPKTDAHLEADFVGFTSLTAVSTFGTIVVRRVATFTDCFG